MLMVDKNRVAQVISNLRGGIVAAVIRGAGRGSNFVIRLPSSCG